MRIIIFISLFLSLFGLSGYYVYHRIVQAFGGHIVSSKLFLILYIFVILAFLMGKFVEQASIGTLSNSLIKIGSVGLGFFIYALLIIIFFDFIRLLNGIIPFFPDIITAHYQKTKLIIGLASLVFVSTVFIYGYTHAKNIKVKTLDLKIHKSQKGFKELNVVAISDIHLGTMVNKNKTKALINKIKKLKPDLILIGGDIIDDNIKVVNHFELLSYFKELNPKYGIYSCLGNHEYISKAHLELDSFEKNGIHMLKDSVALIEDSFYIIGRDDIEGKSYNGKKRSSLQELVKDIDFELPVFLLDHQPFDLSETAKYAVDFQFSGHTHNGQFWPFNYITGLIFEEDWGYLKKNNTHFYISSGFGTAVVPIKIGNDSEIVHIKITNE
ncbi:MAG: hypothetical protein B7C24_08495 [Bacteroidetes bacterium 4572_77]|nr:MAG: hypothetical protein B7C24_08495 [Bacteroidetes bacterium 4572_77]